MDESDSGSEDDHSLTEEEQLRIAAAAVEKRDLKLASLLERKNELPLRTRNRFNELVAELLTKTKEDIHEMICAINIEDADYGGLDSSRDTEAEVETAIRFFPEVISQLYQYGEEDQEEEEYPIQRLCLSNEYTCNLKTVSFIALLARLAIEFHSFEDHERGGLLIEDWDGHNIFDILMWNFSSRLDPNDLLLTLLIRLKRMGLFKKDDIRDYYLVSLSCLDNDFPERVFQFLVEWDPTSLIQTFGCGSLPLHLATTTNIRGFEIAFGYGIRYYPFKKGLRLLFQKDNGGGTPFQTACQKYGRDVVMNVVEEILTRYHSEGTPLHIIEALMVAAADENVHLDCSYFLLRREPDVLVRLLSGPHNNNNNDDGGSDEDGNDDSDGNENNGDNVDHGNDNDEDDDNEGGGGDNGDDENDDNDGVVSGNHDDEDDDNDDGGDEGGIGDSTNNGAGTRKRKRRL